MSEIFVKNLNALEISAVEAESAAARAGVHAGDVLQLINERPILDILDYRFHAAESDLRLTLLRGEETLFASSA